MQQTVGDVERDLEDDQWYQVKEPHVADDVRRYRHRTKSGHIDIDGKSSDGVSQAWADSVYRRAKITKNAK